MGAGVLELFLKNALVRQFLRFAAVGAVATAAHYAVLIVLKELFHVPVLWATSIGYLVGAVVGYTLNRRFTFEANHRFTHGLAKYVAVGVVGLALNGAITTGLMGAGLYYLLAQMVATGVVLIWNFGAARLVVFR